MDLVEAELLQQVIGLLELCLCLAGKANDHIGGDAHLRPERTHLLHALPELSDGVPPPHIGQHIVRPRLHRQRERLAHLRQRGHSLQNPVGHVRWIRGQLTDTHEIVEVVDRAHQVREVGVVGVGSNGRLILAVGLDRLAEQRHFAHTTLQVSLNFAPDFDDWPTALAASPERDDAVGAELVATLDHGNEYGRAGLFGEHLGPELAAVVAHGQRRVG